MIFRITGNEQHPQMGAKRGEAVRGRPSRPVVDAYVRYQDVDLPVSLLALGHGFVFRAGFQYPIRAARAKNQSQHPQHRGIVIKN
jgi:hypothetical protein